MVMDIYGSSGVGFDTGVQTIARFLAAKQGTSPCQEKSNVTTRLACLVVQYGAVSVNRRLAGPYSASGHSVA